MLIWRRWGFLLTQEGPGIIKSRINYNKGNFHFRINGMIIFCFSKTHTKDMKTRSERIRGYYKTLNFYLHQTYENPMFPELWARPTPSWCYGVQLLPFISRVLMTREWTEFIVQRINTHVQWKLLSLSLTFQNSTNSWSIQLFPELPQWFLYAWHNTAIVTVIYHYY
jgi:hypothetical protein